MSDIVSRRQFLVVGLTLWPTLSSMRRGSVCGHSKAGLDDHPTPRKGIDASRVLSATDLSRYPDAIAAFEEVRQIPAIIDGIRCQCGCAGGEGFYSLLSCFEGKAAMARHCELCQGHARYAFRLHKSGKTLDEIRKAIEIRYG